MSQKLKYSTDERDRLLNARRSGLVSSQEANALRAHGKVVGMDTFSWVNPDLDGLARMIDSMPNAVIWMVELTQLKWLVDHYSELTNKLHTVVIYDHVSKGSIEWLNDLNNVAFTKGVTDALMFVNAFDSEEKSFFFTTHGAGASNRLEEFESYLNQLYS